MIQPRVKYEPAAGAATTMLNVQFLSKLVLNVNFVWTQCRGLTTTRSYCTSCYSYSIIHATTTTTSAPTEYI